MTFPRLALVVMAVALVIVGCSKADPPTVSSPTTPPANAASPTPDKFAAVRVIYAKECVSCHGEKGQGGPTKVDGKTIKVPALSSGHALQHPDNDFITQINEGGDGMPPFGKKLSPKEIEDLVAFIRKELQHK